MWCVELAGQKKPLARLIGDDGIDRSAPSDSQHSPTWVHLEHSRNRWINHKFQFSVEGNQFTSTRRRRKKNEKIEGDSREEKKWSKKVAQKICCVFVLWLGCHACITLRINSFLIDVIYYSSCKILIFPSFRSTNAFNFLFFFCLSDFFFPFHQRVHLYSPFFVFWIFPPQFFLANNFQHE